MDDARRPTAAARDGTGAGARLSFGVFGGMAAWVAHLALSYLAVPIVCGTAGEGLLHLVTLGTAGVAGGAAAVSWRGVRRSGGANGDDAGAFLAAAGLLLSGFFLFLILVEGLPVLLQGEPCRGIPVGDQPIIMGEPQAPAAATSVASATAPAALAGFAGPGEPAAAAAGWTWDPWILAALYLATAIYLKGLRRLWRRAGRGRGIGGWHAAAYVVGIAALAGALLSPVHALGEALFSAHMVQHLLLMVVAAPLLVLGRPWIAWAWAVPRRRRRLLARGWHRLRGVRRVGRGLAHPLAILALHVVVLWAWHVPALYEAALDSRAVHHLEHATFFVSAVLFWWVLARAGSRSGWAGQGAAILYVFAVALQSGALGALILFAPEAWYPLHAWGAAAHGTTPLEDQQLAGVLMWVPAGLAYTAAGAALLAAWLRRTEVAVARGERRRRFGATLLVGATTLLVGCDMGRAELEPRQVAGGDPEAGREAVVRHGCGACHTIPGIDEATGRVAPPLTAFADRGFVAGVLPNNADDLVRWIRDPPAVNPATAMPDLGVSEADARHIAAYLYTLH